MIKYLLEKEFKQLLRNPMLPRMLLVFPCIILLVLPWAANFEIKNMNLSIADPFLMTELHRYTNTDQATQRNPLAKFNSPF